MTSKLKILIGAFSTLIVTTVAVFAVNYALLDDNFKSDKINKKAILVSEDDKVIIKGSNFYSYKNWTAISATPRYNCGIAAGEIYCWGSNEDREYFDPLDELGIERQWLTFTPMRIKRPKEVSRWLKISTGEERTCAIADNKQIYCWNIADDMKSYLPAKITIPNNILGNKNISGWKDISISEKHLCALTEYDQIYCSSAESETLNGVLGNGNKDVDTVYSKRIMQPVSNPANVTGWKKVVANNGLSCGISKNDQIYCWGKHGIGDGFKNKRMNPTKVINPKNVTSWKDISNRHDYNQSSHLCAIANDNQIYCWGLDESMLLSEEKTEILKPTLKQKPKHVISWKKVSTSKFHDCAIANDNQIYCWGKQRVNGNKNDSIMPIKISLPSGVKSWKEVTTGLWHNCAIADNDLTYCWGGGHPLINGINVLGNFRLGHDNYNEGSIKPVLINRDIKIGIGGVKVGKFKIISDKKIEFTVSWGPNSGLVDLVVKKYGYDGKYKTIISKEKAYKYIEKD